MSHVAQAGLIHDVYVISGLLTLLAATSQVLGLPLCLAHVMLGMKPQITHIDGKHSTKELYLQFNVFLIRKLKKKHSAFFI